MDTNVQAQTIFLFEELENIYNKGYANIWFMKCMLQNLTRSPPHWFTDNSTIKGLYSIDIFYCDSLYLQRELKFQCVLYDFTIPSAHISFYRF